MADKSMVKQMDTAALELKLNLLKLCHQKLIHIGGDLSLADIMTVLWQYAMNYDVKKPDWEERDRFVLSKGHAAAVTSFSQAAIGCYDEQDIFKEYATDYGRFGMHSCNLINPYVDVSTGSLGLGLSVATGIATGLKAKGNTNSRVYVVMGDGEQHQGTIWEAAMLAPQFKLGNLVGIIDRNNFSFDGETEKIMALEPLAEKWRSFNWNVIEVDGHNVEELIETFDALSPAAGDVPTLIISKSIKGNGVSFMAANKGWHAGRIDSDLYEKATNELKDAYSRKWGEQ